MKVAIIGSRGFDDYDLLCKLIGKIKKPISEIVSGGARGADSLGARYAKENDIPLKVFEAQWDDIEAEGALVRKNRYGNLYNSLAGFWRNKDIVDRAEMVVAFWDEKSKGTENSVQRARARKKPLIIVNFEEKKVKKENIKGEI